MSEELREWSFSEDCAPDEPFDEPPFSEPQPIMNANGLLPCPFCGGSAKVMRMSLDAIEGSEVWGVFCIPDLQAEEHGGYQHGHFIDNYTTEVEAIAAWNTRAERTCHMVERPDGYGSYDYVCSECGAFDNGTPYCWNCGAKVMEE